MQKIKIGTLIKLATLACTLYAGSAAATYDATAGTVLVNATIVSTRTGLLTRDQSLLIEGGKITRIGPAGSIRAVGAARLVDAGGRYLVPGYLDMHTHAMGAVDRQPSHWPLMIANGITGIREMGGSAALIARARQLNLDSAAGRVNAPEVLAIPGDLLVGIQSAAQAVASVQAQKAMGASFVKLVNANREGTLAVLSESRAQGLRVAGHVPLPVTTVDAALNGWHAIEHLGAGMGMQLDCSSKDGEIRQALLGGAGAPPVNTPFAIISPMLYRTLDGPFYAQALASYDPVKCSVIARIVASSGTWQVPTLIRLRAAYDSSATEFRTDPNLMYVDKGTRALWEQLGQQATTLISPASTTAFQHFYQAQRRLVKLNSQQGVKMMTGSDLGGIWVVPGFGLHQEFRELATAGLTPLQVLQMTTLNGAQFLKREASMGTVESGKNADLVLLDDNPIADVANLSKIAGVFLKGRYFSRDALAAMKRDVAAAHEAAPQSSAQSAIDDNHVH